MGGHVQSYDKQYLAARGWGQCPRYGFGVKVEDLGPPRICCKP